MWLLRIKLIRLGGSDFTTEPSLSSACVLLLDSYRKHPVSILASCMAQGWVGDFSAGYW